MSGGGRSVRVRRRTSATFEDCPRELDILIVPGGFGQQQHMADPEVHGMIALFESLASAHRRMLARCALARSEKDPGFFASLRMTQNEADPRKPGRLRKPRRRCQTASSNAARLFEAGDLC